MREYDFLLDTKKILPPVPFAIGRYDLGVPKAVWEGHSAIFNDLTMKILERSGHTTGCATRNPVEDAKAIVKSHEELVKAGNLDRILGNMSDNIVALVPGMPLLKGMGAFFV